MALTPLAELDDFQWVDTDGRVLLGPSERAL